MARARNIKPGFFTNDDLAECEPLARILFVGLWTVADREGRLEDKPRKIKAMVLPYDDADCDKLLAQLHGKNFITRYVVDGNEFIQINNWKKHQKPTIIDGDESKENKETTDWEASVAKLLKKYWPRIKDADRRNMVGRYSALLIQLRDNKEWNEEVDYSVIKNIKEKALVNLIPLWEPQIKVAEWDNDITSETYGQPLMYDFDE